MKKFMVYGVISASVVLGTYEAENADEAMALADKDNNANWHPSLCHQCSREVDLGDVYETIAEEVTE